VVDAIKNSGLPLADQQAILKKVALKYADVSDTEPEIRTVTTTAGLDPAQRDYVYERVSYGTEGDADTTDDEDTDTDPPEDDADTDTADDDPAADQRIANRSAATATNAEKRTVLDAYFAGGGVVRIYEDESGRIEVDMKDEVEEFLNFGLLYKLSSYYYPIEINEFATIDPSNVIFSPTSITPPSTPTSINAIPLARYENLKRDEVGVVYIKSVIDDLDHARIDKKVAVNNIYAIQGSLQHYFRFNHALGISLSSLINSLEASSTFNELSVEHGLLQLILPDGTSPILRFAGALPKYGPEVDLIHFAEGSSNDLNNLAIWY
jgi:hypothetical protein